jgi:hypothetical protein
VGATGKSATFLNAGVLDIQSTGTSAALVFACHTAVAMTDMMIAPAINQIELGRVRPTAVSYLTAY